MKSYYTFLSARILPLPLCALAFLLSPTLALSLARRRKRTRVLNIQNFPRGGREERERVRGAKVSCLELARESARRQRKFPSRRSFHGSTFLGGILRAQAREKDCCARATRILFYYPFLILLLFENHAFRRVANCFSASACHPLSCIKVYIFRACEVLFPSRTIVLGDLLTKCVCTE